MRAEIASAVSGKIMGRPKVSVSVWIRSLGRGEFPAQSVVSDALRRHALRFRHDQAEAIAGAISETDPEIHPLVAHAHPLITVIESADAAANFRATKTRAATRAR